MAINKNHEFEELNGIKCAIVEKNAPAERVAFLKSLLELNKYTVIVTASPPPKAAAAKPLPAPEISQATPNVVAPADPTPAPVPETFTVGVTDVTFNSTNAIFGRLLHTKGGHVITLAYWKQQEDTSRDEVPYFEKDR